MRSRSPLIIFAHIVSFFVGLTQTHWTWTYHNIFGSVLLSAFLWLIFSKFVLVSNVNAPVFSTAHEFLYSIETLIVCFAHFALLLSLSLSVFVWAMCAMLDTNTKLPWTRLDRLQACIKWIFVSIDTESANQKNKKNEKKKNQNSIRYCFTNRRQQSN